MELVRAAGLPLIVVNDAWRLAPWAEVLYACDGRWWDVHHAATKAFEGERWTQDEKAAKQYGLNYIKSEARIGLGTDRIHQGRNSGYQAINLAYLRGARTVLLLGFDMSHDGSRAHFFGSHQGGRLMDCPDYRQFCVAFEQMQPEQYGLKVVNCSGRTALTCFPRVELEEAISSAAWKADTRTLS